MADHIADATKMAPTPNPLSPDAKAVLDAAGDSDPGIYATIVATLRAVADQVVPDEPDYMRSAFPDQGWWDRQDSARNKILAIAAELEGANDRPISRPHPAPPPHPVAPPWRLCWLRLVSLIARCWQIGR